MLQIGFGRVGVFDKRYERTMIEINGIVLLKGKVTMGHGSRVCVTDNAELHIGRDFCNTAMGTIICAKKITIGDNVLTSWNTLIMDTDWHNVIDLNTGCQQPKSKEIHIGNNVWLGTRSVILKGSTIPDGCIVGANAVVTKAFTNENTLIAGNPAKERKQGVTLQREDKAKS